MCPIINKSLKREKRETVSNKRDNLNNIAVYNTHTWRILRILYLSENPLCKRCLKKGLIVPAAHVHHIIEISNGKTIKEKQQLGFDMTNLEGLCQEHHTEHHNNKRRSKKQ
jgi:5-methylcytosine-specific restriction enzyme A